MKKHINGVELAYEDHGMGLPVIFLHAFPLNRRMWTGQIAALLGAARFRLIAPDWRGFGESNIGKEVSTMELLADDLVGLMDILGIQRAVLCGLSMGGYIALAFLRKYPQRFAGLVLADTQAGVDTPEAQEKREQVALQALSEGSGVIAEQQIPRLLTAETRRQRPEIEARVRQLAAAATPAGIAAAARGMGQRRDASDLLASITCPTLVIVGEHDIITPVEVMRDLATHISQSQLSIIPAAGHLANLEQPEAFNHVLQAFLFQCI